MINSSSAEISAFMNTLGYDFSPERILEVYPVFFKDRKVFKIYDQDFNENRVVKVRKDDYNGRMEIDKLSVLLQFYGFPRFKVRYINGNILFDMPWLGVSMGKLSMSLDDPISNEYNFNGFTSEHLERLLKGLREDSEDLQLTQGLIHGDLFQQGSPNNILYHPILDTLFLIDAEALSEVDPKGLDWYETQMSQVKIWLQQNLIVEEA